MEVSTIEHRCCLPQDGRASHAYLHALIENSPTAVVVLDSKHTFQMCNAAFSGLFQFHSSDLEQWGIDTLIASPDFLEEAGEATRAVLLGKRVRLRSKRRRRDGRLIDVEIHGVPLLLDGQVEGVFGLYQEVTERTRFAHGWQGAPEQRSSAGLQAAVQPASHAPQSLFQDLVLLRSNLSRLSRLLPEMAQDAVEVSHQTRQLAALCGDQVRTVEQHFLKNDAGSLAHPVSGGASVSPTTPLRSQNMTERETELVKLLARGLSSKEVASRLHIATRTVETHRSNIYRKLQFRNIADLVLYAVRNDLLATA